MRRKPLTRKISMRSAVHNIAGQEPPYPVHQFSNRVFVERPNHNPFSGQASVGFVTIEDTFAGRVLIDDPPGEAWREINLASYYQLPVLDSGVARSVSATVLSAAIRDDIGSANHFVELELVDCSTAPEFYAGPWCWVRASSHPSEGDSGYYAIFEAGDYGDGDGPKVALYITRWDAPYFYTFVASEALLGSTVVPENTLMRLTADGRDLTATLDYGGTGVIDVAVTYRVPADDPYLTKSSVGFGIDNYYPGDCGIETFRAGMP